MIYLVEHFYSIQGEGRYVGSPSIFFRFGGCNLTCKGFGCFETSPQNQLLQGCDTLYAVDRSFQSSWTPLQTLEQLISVLGQYQFDFLPHIVFTGGEPLLYANEEIFIAFMQYLQAKGYKITFETNGTIWVDFQKNPVFKNATYALSVKLANSDEPHNKRVRPKAITQIAHYADEAFFKFSIDKDSINASLESEIEHITSFAPNLSVYCMPVGGDKKSIEANTPALIEYCKTKGFNFSDRLHIRVWNENKGV